MKKRVLLNILFVITASFILYNCKAGSDLVDPPPRIVQFNEAPEHNDTLFTDEVRIVWTGSEAEVQYQYRMDFIDDSSNNVELLDWTVYDYSRSVTFSGLENGYYTFSLRAIIGRVESGTISRSFFVADSI